MTPQASSRRENRSAGTLSILRPRGAVAVVAGWPPRLPVGEPAGGLAAQVGLDLGPADERAGALLHAREAPLGEQVVHPLAATAQVSRDLGDGEVWDVRPLIGDQRVECNLRRPLGDALDLLSAQLNGDLHPRRVVALSTLRSFHP